MENLRIIAHQVLLQLLLATGTGWAASENCWRPRCATWWADGRSTRWNGERATASLHATKLEFGSTELASSGSLLLEHLLLVSVRVSDLDDVLLSAWLGDRSVIELLDDVLTNIARLEAVKVSE